MKVIVTGGSGLVGKAIQKLRPNWVFLSSTDYDLRDPQEALRCVTDHNPEYVIHLAANVGGLFKNFNSNLEMYVDNVYINTNVLNACYRCNVKKVLSCLSTCIFPEFIPGPDSADGSDGSKPITLDKLHFGPPHQSNRGYALCQAYVTGAFGIVWI